MYFVLPGSHEWGHLSPIWRYLTFTLNFGLDLSKYGTFSHAWSLCVEEQFYLVLPLMFWLLTRIKAGKKSVYVIIAFFIACFVVRMLSWYYLAAPHAGADDFGLIWNKFIYYPSYNRLDGLLVGVSIAGLFTFYPGVRDVLNRYSNLLLLAGLVLLAAAYFISTPQDTFYTCLAGFPLISLAYGTILAALVCPTNVFYKAKSFITSWLATLSYSIYLMHKIIIHVTQHLLEKAGIDKNSNLTMLICGTCIILAALAIRYIIEKPALKLRDKVLYK